MNRKFREWTPRQSWLFPPSPQDWLPEDHLVYFLLDVVETIDTSPMVADYRSDKGEQPLFDPRMMLVLLLCRESGLLNVGRLSLDGTKVKANASRHKAMSFDRMSSAVTRLQEEIDRLLAQAESADESDDDRFGDLRGDEIPAELARREVRLKTIQAAKTALEEQAREKAAAHVEKMEVAGRNHRTVAEEAVPGMVKRLKLCGNLVYFTNFSRGFPCLISTNGGAMNINSIVSPSQAVPDSKAQRNFTDPESKIMKTSNKGFDQCGKAQAVATEDQIIVSADVTDQATTCVRLSRWWMRLWQIWMLLKLFRNSAPAAS